MYYTALCVICIVLCAGAASSVGLLVHCVLCYDSQHRLQHCSAAQCTPPTSAGPLHVGVGANVGLGLDTLEHCLLAQLMPHYVYVLCNGSVHC